MMTEITEPQARALAALVHALRNDWDERGVLAKLAEARTRGDAYDLAHAALYAAAAESNRTPAVIPLAGTHWTRGKVLGEADRLRAARCHEPGHTSYLAANCGACRAERIAGDHDTPTDRAMRAQGVPRDRIRAILTAATPAAPDPRLKD